MSEYATFSVVAIVIILLLCLIWVLRFISCFLAFCFIRRHSSPTAAGYERECPKCLRKSSYDICYECSMYTIPTGLGSKDL